MTTVAEEAKEGSLPASAQEAEPNAEMRACANSVTAPSSVASQAVTESVQAARRAAVRTVALLDKPGSLAHAQPPTFAQARERHHECAGHFSAPIVKWLRLLWGYVHLGLIKPVLNLAEWVTESPARFAVTAILVAVIWVWG